MRPFFLLLAAINTVSATFYIQRVLATNVSHTEHISSLILMMAAIATGTVCFLYGVSKK